MNPYLTEFIGLNVLAGILGSGTSAIAMFFEHLSDGLLAKGANAGALHRLAPACATGMKHIAKRRWYGGAASLDEIIPCRELLVCIRDLGSCTDGRILCCCDRSNDYLLVRIL